MIIIIYDDVFVDCNWESVLDGTRGDHESKLRFLRRYLVAWNHPPRACGGQAAPLLLACGGGGSSGRVGADTSAGQPVQYSNDAKSTLGFIGEPSDASEPVIAFGTAEHDAMPRRCVNHFPLRSGGCVF